MEVFLGAGLAAAGAAVFNHASTIQRPYRAAAATDVEHQALAVDYARHLESASVTTRTDAAQVADASSLLAIVQLQGRTVSLGDALSQERAAGRPLIYVEQGQKYLMTQLGPGRWVKNSRIDASVVELAL